MIASVSGIVTSASPEAVVLQVGGVGLLVQAAPHTIAELTVGSTATVHTSLVVREDSLTLFGFGTADERGVFELLQSASGVGPKVAQAMLGVLRPDELRRAITAGDLATLTRVPGVGKKGAERIVLELRDRIGPPVGGAGRPVDHDGMPASDAGWVTPLTEALVGLGWSQREAEGAIVEVEPLARDGAALPDLLKAALRSLRRT